MLGACRTVATAAWGVTPPSFKASGTVGITKTVNYDGAWQLNTSNRSLSDGWMSPDGSEIDMTGLTSETGFNNRRYAFTTTFYAPSSYEFIGGLIAGTFVDGTNGEKYHTIGINDFGNGPVIVGGFDNYTGSNPFTWSDIASEWCQLWVCGSETSNSFDGWTNMNGGSGSNYNRFLLVRLSDMETIVQWDFQDNAYRPDFSSLGNTLYVGGFNNSTPEFNPNQFGNSNYKTIGIAYWFGHTIDPLGTNPDQIYGKPRGTVDGKKAFVNAYWDGYDSVANGGNYNFYSSHDPDADDRFTAENSRVFNFDSGISQATFETYYTSPADLKIG